MYNISNNNNIDRVAIKRLKEQREILRNRLKISWLIRVNMELKARKFDKLYSEYTIRFSEDTNNLIFHILRNGEIVNSYNFKKSSEYYNYINRQLSAEDFLTLRTLVEYTSNKVVSIIENMD